MKRTIALLAALLAVPVTITLAQPATAEAGTTPTAQMILVRNVTGSHGTGYRCIVTAGGAAIDCDWSTPVRMPYRTPVQP